ncbi:MAG TPA: CARDB domain-containing protein, partial [Rudaea sp.]
VLSGVLDGRDATLTWTASTSPDVARYDLLRDGAIVASRNTGDTLAYVDANLTIGPHSWIVVAYDGANNASAASNTVTLTVDGTPPVTPINLAVTAPPTGGALDVAWQPAPGETPAGYVLLRATAQGGPYAVIATPIATNYHDAPLTNGTTYFYTVEATNAFGDRSAPTAPVSGTPRDRVAPPSPVLTYPTAASWPVSLDADTTRVCGAGEPGALIALSRDGTSIGSATVGGVFIATPLSFNNGNVDHIVPGPDGVHVATLTASAALIVTNTAVPDEFSEAPNEARQPLWAAHGLTLYYLDANSDDLYRWPIGSGQDPELVPQPITSVTTFAPNARETAFAFYGVLGADTGVFLVDRASGAPRRVTGLDGFTAAVSLVWSPDGTHLLVYGDQFDLAVVDTTTAATTTTILADVGNVPSWNRDGSRFVFTLYDEVSDREDLKIFDIATGMTTTIIANDPGYNAIAWSPADDSIALLGATFDVVSAVDGTSRLLTPYDTFFNWQNLAWTPSGAIVADDSVDALRFDVPGWFCVEAAPLVTGANRFIALPSDASGNVGLPSAPIEVDRIAADLPDLAVSAPDILFLPPSGLIGQDYNVLVTLHNTGTQPAAQPLLIAHLTAPDGTQQTLQPTAPLSDLAPGDIESATFALGVLNAAGNYRFDVTADPGNRIDEISESNNTAAATLTLSADGTPVLELNLSRSLFAPGDVVDGTVAVTNPGSAFTGILRTTVLDASGDFVADLGDVSSQIAFGQRWTTPIAWNAQNVLAGDYQMRARLLDAGGAQIAEVIHPFTIAAVRHFQLSLTATPTTQTIGSNVAIHSDLEFSDGNALLSGATLRLTALDPNGAEVWRVEQALGALVPGASIARDDAWPTANLVAGVYALHLALISDDANESTDASVTLITATPNAALTGTLAFAPNTTLIAGQSVALTAHVANSGGLALDGVQARLRIVAAQGQAAESQSDDTFDIDIGGAHDFTTTLTAPPLALASHLAILEARLDSDPPDQWRRLTQQGFTVVDLTPPTIAVINPIDTVVQPAVVPFRATIVDRDSAVADAAVSVDGGTWQPISADTDGYYGRGLTGLTDGAHTLSVRARDTWGNLAQTPSLAFTVDATPPAIVVTGVQDNDDVNHDVTPIVTITDAHLATSDVRVNGTPFVSGTAVTADGSYVLSIRASDEAGNQSQASIRFTIDRVAPSITITAPADGSTVTTATVNVAGTTEALANVHFTTGAFSADVSANAGGVFTVPNVALQPGANTLTAQATDRASNSGASASISITYVAPQLRGTIGPLAAQVKRGDPIDAPYTLNNDGSSGLVGLPVRIEVRP